MRAMKDSGIEWIGEIPKVWHSCKVKHVSSLNGRIGWQGLTSNEYMECGPFLITGTDFKEGKINWENCVHISLERYEEAKQIQIRNGDLLITKDGTIGKVAIVNDLSDKASLNSGVLLIRPLNDEKYVVRFKYYILISEIFWKWYESTKTGNSTILHLYQEKFKEFSYPLPPLPEQTRIATFLDKKCTAIDAAIEKQRASIDRLKEYRQAVITEAVTKGLNPDVPMKDSGVEWIGEIPEGWDLRRLKFLCTINTGDKDTVNKNGDGLYPFYVRSPNIERIDTYAFDGEAILMAGDGVGAGKVFHYVNGKFDYHQRVYSLHFFKDVFGKYLYYYLKENFWKKIEEGSAKSTVDSVRLPMLLDFPVVYGNIFQQTEIAAYLDNKCTAIDEAVSRKEKLIEKLEEYKKSLIYEAVTGKIEVPELSA